MNPFLKGLQEDRAALAKTIEDTLANVKLESRDALSEAEEKTINEVSDKIEALDAQIKNLSEIELRNAEAASLAKRVSDANGTEANDKSFNFIQNRTYGEKTGASFFADLFDSKAGNTKAQERLSRHSAEMENRDVTSASFGSLITPQYLNDAVAEYKRAGRPFANVCQRIAIPLTGNAFTIEIVTTPTAVGSRATETTAVTSQDIDTTALDIYPEEISGQVNITRRSVDRGVGTDVLTMRDLVRAYNTKLDYQLIQGAGHASQELQGVIGTSNVISVTYDDVASPTVAEFAVKVGNASAQIAANTYEGADIIVMSPRRWQWIASASDTTGRPLVVPSPHGPANAVSVGNTQTYGDTGMQYQGLRVIVDGNIPTNYGYLTSTDPVIVANSQNLLLWEDDNAPYQLRMDQVNGNTLGLKFVVYGYVAFTAGRYPKSAAVISGNGLVNPF